jgi:hypothetical protein
VEPAESVGGCRAREEEGRENICGRSTGGRGRHVRRAGDRGGVTWRQRGQWLAIRAHAARVRPRYFVRRAAAGAGGAGTRGRLSGGGSRSAVWAGDTWSVRDARAKGDGGWVAFDLFVKSCGCGGRGARGVVVANSFLTLWRAGYGWLAGWLASRPPARPGHDNICTQLGLGGDWWEEE